MDTRILPTGAYNSYAMHPGFDEQECPVQYVVHPANSRVAPGFGCKITGGHCLPGEHCTQRRADFAKRPF